MYLVCGVMLASLAIASESTETATDHVDMICPVGFPGTIKAHLKSSSLGKVKSATMICENDSDCPHGKCCGILGENICLYDRDHHPHSHPSNTDGDINNFEQFQQKFSDAVSRSKVERPDEHKSEDDITVERVKNGVQGGNCLNKTGNGWNRDCGSGFRWRYVFFIISLSGLFTATSFVSLTVCCKKHEDLDYWEAVMEKELVSVAAVGDPSFYKIPDDKKIVLDMKDQTTMNQTEQNHVTGIGSDVKRELQA